MPGVLSVLRCSAESPNSPAIQFPKPVLDKEQPVVRVVISLWDCDLQNMINSLFFIYHNLRIMLETDAVWTGTIVKAEWSLRCRSVQRCIVHLPLSCKVGDQMALSMYLMTLGSHMPGCARILMRMPRLFSWSPFLPLSGAYNPSKSTVLIRDKHKQLRRNMNIWGGP